jgi:predicted molibdopterin-dependent oxidoreductase YjgC
MYLGNLALLTGNVGRPGTGVNPLRGQNNVQGACDMGALPNVFVGYQGTADPKSVEKFEKAYGVKLSNRPGLTSTVMFKEAIPDGRIKALFILGEDPAQTEPNTSHVVESLKKLEFMSIIEIFPSETTKHADVILPGASAVEKFGTFANGERRVQRVNKSIEPLAGRADWQTLCAIAEAMGYPMKYNHPSEIWDEVRALAPHLFGGMSYERLKFTGLQWPCPSETHPGTATMYEEKFNTPSGRGIFNFVEHKGPEEQPDAQYPLVLTTGRRRQHYNNGSMTRRNKGILEIWPEETLEISPMDAEELGISDWQKVRVVSRRGQVEVKAHVTDRSQRGVVYMSFHYDNCLTNLITNDALDPVARTPEYKACAVRVEPLDGEPKKASPSRGKSKRRP